MSGRELMPVILRTAVVAATAAALVPGTASAAPTPNQQIQGKGGNVGLGLSLGDPMGGSLKWFLAPKHALQFDLGWAPLHHGHGRLGMDYLWHPAALAKGAVAHLVPYLGLGLGMAFWAGGRCYGGRHGRRDRCRNGGAAMFMRAPVVGLAVHWQKVPLDTVLEGSWAPYLVLPDLGHGDVSLKIRYYF